ncbi:MAG: PrsW family intramembrane metalloprotease [Anaerolineae bacterium]|jgi:RsiW-degrading membrane proteinase PrsW (M82 family)
MLIVAGIIAVLLPLVFLYVIYALDLYASGRFRTVVTCFAWGMVAFGLAYVLNTAIKTRLLEDRLGMWSTESMTMTVVLVAPIVEEIVKSLALVYFGRRLTYFVDGAIYGFAAGIGFSVLENLFYLFQPAGQSQGALLAVSRSFSTCLMHGSASALVGAAIGRFRYGHGWTRLLSALLGWAAAIALHSGFNRVVEYWDGTAFLLGAVGLGVGGVVLIALFIRWGLVEERRWIEETLGSKQRVTSKEKALVRELASVQELLKPIEERFGREKTIDVEDFLLKQAQLGIKQKSSQMLTDPRHKSEVEAQIAQLQDDMEALRRKVGIYVMTYVRSIFPPEATLLWSNLQQLVTEAQQKAETQAPQFNLWGRLQTEAQARTEVAGAGSATQSGAGGAPDEG